MEKTKVLQAIADMLELLSSSECREITVNDRSDLISFNFSFVKKELPKLSEFELKPHRSNDFRPAVPDNWLRRMNEATTWGNSPQGRGGFDSPFGNANQCLDSFNPFIGEPRRMLNSNGFVTYERLCGLVSGKDIEIDQGDAGWLIFKENGKDLVIANKPLITNVSWSELNKSGVVDGTGLIEIGDKTFSIRLPTSDEWRRLILPLSKTNHQFYESTVEKPVWCKDMVSGNKYHRYIGDRLSIGYSNVRTKNPLYGWCPVLELVK